MGNLLHKFSNNAASVLLADITGASNTLTIRVEDAGLFPVISTGEFFRITLENIQTGIWEICEVTAVSGASNNIFTIVRGREGSSANAFAQGSKVELRWTKGAVDSLIDYIDDAAGFGFVFNQSSASATWTIIHNMGKYPSVTLQDSLGGNIMGEITYNTINQLTVVFSESIAGKAYLN